MRQLSFRVPGMSCRHCVRTVSAAVSDVAGVQAVEVDLDTLELHVHGTADEDAIRAALVAVGYPADR